MREERRAMRRANQGQPHQLMIYTEQGSKNVHTLHKHHSRVSIIALSHLNTFLMSPLMYISIISLHHTYIFSVIQYAKYGTLCTMSSIIKCIPHEKQDYMAQAVHVQV